MSITNKRIYLDYAAAAPLAPEARAAMSAVMEEMVGNPSAIHAEGQRARDIVETARVAVARAVMARPEQVVFTSGGTEANNLAVHAAIAQARQVRGAAATLKVLTTAIEHPSLLKPLEALQDCNVVVDYVPVAETGEIILSELQQRLTPEVVLVTFAYINSEVGTIQPVRALGHAVREYAAQHDIDIWLHLDGAQAPYWVSCQWDSLRVDTLALDAGKCGGPLGAGALLHGVGRTLVPLQRGGGQERGLRAGTEAVIQIAGTGAALAAAQAQWRTRAAAVRVVRDAAWQHCRTLLPQVYINGSEGDARVANNLHISLPEIDTEYATVVLDAHGVAVSTKSACAGAGGGASAVVLAMTGDAARAHSTLRFTLGPETTHEDMERVFQILQRHCAQQSTLT